MGRLGIDRMPVVRPAAPDRPIAFVRQTALARAYYLALNRERSQEELHAQLRLRELTGHEIVEVRVPPNARLRGVPLQRANLPRESIVIAIRRRGRTLFPHGDTTIEAGDTVVANVAPGFGPGFRERIVEGDEARPTNDDAAGPAGERR
jgi:hypothetical protein